MITDALTEAEQRPVPKTATTLLLQIASARLGEYGVGLDIDDMVITAVGIRQGQRILHINPVPEKTHWRGIVPMGYSPLSLGSQLANVELLIDDDCQSAIRESLSHHLVCTADLEIDIHPNACTIRATCTNLFYRGQIRIPFRVRAKR